MTNRPWPTNIIVWSRERSLRLLGLAALMVLTFAVDGPVARPKAYATLAEAIAATVPGGSLTQEAYIKSSNPDIEDRLGTVMAMSGDTVVVGSVPEDSNAVGVNGNAADNSMLSAGAAYVFVRTSAGWIQQAYLKASNTGPDDRFGTSVAIDGDIIVVGTDFEDSNATVVNGIQSNNSATQAGAAYVFVRAGTTWTQQAYLKPSNLQTQDHFGIAVGVSGETIVVGSFGEDSAAAGVNGNQADNTASAAGAAYVFVRSGATWTQQAYLKASNPNADDHFGRTVAIDDDTILVGAVGIASAGGEDSCATGVNGDETNNGCVNAGAVYAFVRSGTTWTQQAYLKASNSAASDLFGYSLAVDGDRAVVSAFLEDSGAVVINGDDTDDSMPSAGAAYIFERSGTTWGQTAYLKSPNTKSNGLFGEYVAIDGDVVVVGHPQEGAASAGVMFGAAYVFTPGASGWGLTHRLTASNPANADYFGKSVAVSDGIVVVAAHGEDSGAAGINGDQSDNSASHSGALYAFSPSANAAPLASAGPDQVVPATSASGADVTLNGTGSTDPDGDALTYTWREGATVLGTGVSLTTSATLGTHTITLTVDDGNGGQSSDDVIVEVRDALSVTAGTPPVAPATYTYGQMVLASYSCGSTANLLASCVGSVPVGAAINTASLGTHVFEVTATNSLGESSSSSWTYEVIKAASSVVVNCPASVSYAGAAHTVCTATATGAGMTPVDVSASLMYVSNVNVGTATVSASWAGDTNHNGSAGLGNFAIVTAPVAATFTANSKVYDGTTAAPAAGLSCLLSGVAVGDLNDVVCSPSAAAFDNPNAGGPRTVSATLTLTGSAATNYTFGAPGTAVLSTIATNATTTTTAGVVYGQAGAFTTALSNNTGGVAGVTSASSLITPRGIAADADGNIYLVDQGNARVLFYPFGQTTATRVYGQGGNFTTGIANNGGVSASSLSGSLTRLAVDASGLYVADSGNHRVLFFPTGSTTATRVYGQGGDFSTNTANKGGLSADSLNTPRGMALDDAGNLYLSDTFNNRVLFFPAGSTTATRVYGQDGSFTTSLANNTAGVAGVVSAASLFRPNGLQLDSQGNLYVADASNNRVLVFPSGQTTASRVYGQHGDFTTAIANNGGISADSISTPPNISVDGGDNLYVADSGNHRLLFFPAGSTTATQVYGQAGSFATGVLNNGGVSADSFNLPNSVDLDAAGNIYVSDTNNNRVLRFNASTPSITPAPLLVTASNGTKNYGTTFEVTPVYTGFVNGETAGVLSSQPVCTSAGSAPAAVMGTYATTCSGAAGSNYSISYLAGTLTVEGSVPVTATLTAAGKTYDGTTAEPNASMSCTLTGVLAADLANVTCTASDGMFDSADAGGRTVSATVTLGGSAASNYTFGTAGSVMPSTSATTSATIAKANATITVTGYAVTYDGAPHTATGSATGVLGEDLSALLQLGNTTHTNAGGYVEDNWTFAGNGNYEATSGFVDNTIAKASSATVVTCPASVTYTGAALESCTAAVTGAGGLDEVVAVTYTNNTNAGTASASATFAGDANHESSTASASFTIAKASSSTVVTCPASVTYTGAALESCTAAVTGAGGLAETVSVSYTNNTNAGTANASATFAGDANHESSTASATFTITKATSATVVTCPVSVTYTGAALESCTAAVTGAGGLDETVSVSYTNNTNAGTASASATFAGDANHESSTASASFTIAKASSSTVVTCPASVTYTGAALESCTAAVTGAGGLAETVSVSYTNNTNAGTANASATFAGDANHESSTASATFTIAKATSATVVSCPASVTYTGSALESCTAAVTGAGGLDEVVAVTYTNNTNVGTASASATFAGDANHESSTASASFTIAKATSATVVSCPASVTYTGSALESCTAAVTGAGSLAEPVAVTYTNNTNAGTASASATFAGDANHESSTASASFTIAKATSATVVSCPVSVTYTGSALESCTAAVTGAGGLAEPVAVTYTNNTNAGTASASATFAGDTNHESSTGSATFTIVRLASPTVTTVTCPASVVFSGAAHQVCTATVTGADGFSQTIAVSYSNNVMAGTATATASFGGNNDHEPSADAATFAITPASLTVTADNKSKLIGSADPAFTYQVSGLVGGDSAAGVLTGTLGRDPGEAAGSYTIRQGTLASNGNYALTVVTGTLTIGYNTCVLYDPTKAVKSGATIPLKIRLCSATGANVSNSATVVTAVSLMRISSSATMDVVDAGNSNADGNFRFDPTLGPGYIFNFKTTGLAQGTYRLEIRVTNDSQPHFLTFQVR